MSIPDPDTVLAAWENDMKNDWNLNRDREKHTGTMRALLADLVCAILSYLLAVRLRFGAAGVPGETQIQAHGLTLFAVLAFLLLYHAAFDPNRGFLRRGSYVELMVICKRNLVLAAVWGACLFLLQEAQNFSRLVFLYYMLLNTVLSYAAHLLLKRYLRLRCRKERSQSKLLLIADAAQAQTLLRRIVQTEPLLYEVTGAVLWDRDQTGSILEGIPVVAARETLYDVIRQMPLDEVLIYLPAEDRSLLQQMIRNLEGMGLVCHYGIDLVGLEVQNKSLGTLGGLAVVSYALNVIDHKHQVLKRCMDLAGSLAGLAVTAILFPFVALAIRLESPGPVLFRQVRIGRNGRRFQMYKFRSMYADAEARKQELLAQNEMSGPMFKLEKDPRVTRVGRFLRKTSIDELPQFYNVLKGDMSLVGTRPPTETEFEQYDLYYRRRLSMTPGLTGMWQVSGRSEIRDFEDVVRLDLKYIDNWSLSLDVKIILQTILTVLFGRGAK